RTGRKRTSPRSTPPVPVTTTPLRARSRRWSGTCGAAISLARGQRQPDSEGPQQGPRTWRLSLSGGVIEVAWWQVLYLPPGDAEADAAIAEAGHHLGGNRGVGAVPRVPVPDHHVGHPAAAGVDAHRAQVSGLAVGGVHAVTAVLLHLTRRDDVDG